MTYRLELTHAQFAAAREALRLRSTAIRADIVNGVTHAWTGGPLLTAQLADAQDALAVFDWPFEREK